MLRFTFQYIQRFTMLKYLLQAGLTLGYYASLVYGTGACGVVDAARRGRAGYPCKMEVSSTFTHLHNLFT